MVAVGDESTSVNLPVWCNGQQIIARLDKHALSKLQKLQSFNVSTVNCRNENLRGPGSLLYPGKSFQK